ncbi:MAG: hypothetical protein LBP59_01715 [Planctomycetaceae bacterium]|jgi:hypothetical protein|nr:hypothetical protein [Planctomycetaceae bacterium]
MLEKNSKDKKSKKNKKQDERIERIAKHFIICIFATGCAIIILGMNVRVNIQDTYVDVFPFNKNWKAVGDGYIIKREVNMLKGRRSHEIVYIAYTFIWSFNNSEKKYEGRCISFDSNFKDGDKVTIVAYKGKPYKTKIIGTYSTPIRPESVYIFLFLSICIIAFFFTLRYCYLKKR